MREATRSPERQLAGFLAKYDPAVRRVAGKVLASMRAALERAGVEPDRAQAGRLIIKSVAVRQRPRRPARREV